MALFERHGMRNVGYWIPTETANTLIYIVAHTDAAAAKKSWADFEADPGWKKVYANSIADGPIVNNIDSVLMNAADYSPLQ